MTIVQPHINCPHGMPTKGSCFECMEEGPVAPPSKDVTQKYKAMRWIESRYDGQCARNFEHKTSKGDWIGEVPGIGWCCEDCAE